MPGYAAYAWDAMGAPANTPARIIDTLNKAINAVLADPATKAKFADLGAEAMIMTQSEFGQFMADEIEKVGQSGAGRQYQARLSYCAQPPILDWTD